MDDVFAIRFLPMGTNIFQDKDEVLRFLASGLHKQQGYYYYIKRNIVLDGNTLVLFQFQGELIASAIMVNQDDTHLESNGVAYKGRYHFDTESIVIFEEPIIAEEWQAIDTTFTGFNQSTRSTDIKYLDEIMQLIENKSTKESEEKTSSGETYAVLNKPRIKTVQEWELILKHEKEHNKGFNFVERVLLEMYKRDDYAIFCRSFEKEIGYKGLNLRVGDFRNRIKKINGVNLAEQIRKDTNTDRAWNIPFETDEWLNKNSNSGSFCWVLRKELIKAIENVYPEIKQERKAYVERKEMEYALDLKDKPVVHMDSAEYMKGILQPGQTSTSERKYFPPKVDYVLKQIRNKVVGDAGEEKIVHEEKATLKQAGREDLAEQVHIVPSDAYGYDVLSYYPDGSEKHIEVKTSTSASDDVMFHITANEVNTIMNDSAYVLHYLYATKEDIVKIVTFSNQDLRGEIIKKYMTPTQFVVRMKKE